MNNQAVLACQNLAKHFDDGTSQLEVLKDVNLSVAKGEQIAIVGASGEGKSTLLHLLGGLEKPTRGEIILDGLALQHLDERALSKQRNEKLGFIYQFHHLLPEFTALENVAMPLLIRGTNPKIAEAKAREVLAAVGLEKRLQHKPAQLSGGERQRTAVARALVTEPQCILADEPTGNLDHHTAEQVYETMLMLNRNIGTSFIVVTHDQQLASRMDRVLTLKNGELIFP